MQYGGLEVALFALSARVDFTTYLAQPFREVGKSNVYVREVKLKEIFAVVATAGKNCLRL